MYEENAKEVFEANPSLFNKMKDFDNREIRDWEAFREYVLDKRFTSDNQLFNFVKVE